MDFYLDSKNGTPKAIMAEYLFNKLTVGNSDKRNLILGWLPTGFESDLPLVPCGGHIYCP